MPKDPPNTRAAASAQRTIKYRPVAEWERKSRKAKKISTPHKACNALNTVHADPASVVGTGDRSSVMAPREYTFGGCEYTHAQARKHPQLGITRAAHARRMLVRSSAARGVSSEKRAK